MEEEEVYDHGEMGCCDYKLRNAPANRIEKRGRLCFGASR